MQIARLQNEKSVADVAARVYGLTPGDPRAAAATAALTAANPHLTANLATRPAGTPVVVPAVAGLSPQSSVAVNPKQTAWTGTLDKMVDSATQAFNAQDTGSAATAPQTPAAQRTAALAQLTQDIADFKKLHSS